MRIFTSESVTEGHPDKVADRISDSVVDLLLGVDNEASVACEALVSSQIVVLAGEIRCNEQEAENAWGVSDIEPLVKKVIDPKIREAIREIGYDRLEVGFHADEVEVINLVNPQSSDINQGVSDSWEWRVQGSKDPLDRIGAGDQGMMFGFATWESDQLMPLPIALAHKLAHQLAQARRSGRLPYLYPDGKTQVSVEYGPNGSPVRVKKLVISAHHSKEADIDQLEQDLRQHVVGVAGKMGEKDWFEDVTLLVNPSGKFEKGGPVADAGLTGRKIIVDTYGGYARHGGGAFSGKDPTKVDRSGAYYARYVAKNIVEAKLAEKCEIQVSYAIGKANPVSLDLDTFGTEKVDCNKIRDLLKNRDFFDFRPEAIFQKLGLRNPIYTPTSSYGHFGRPDYPWEQTDMAQPLAEAAG